MSTYTLPIPEWVEPLRNLALGTSVAALFLVPAASYSVLVIEQQPVNSEIGFVVTFTNGFAGLRPLFNATSSGLETPTFQKTAQQTNDTIELDRIPHLLREMSGLPVETLASLAHVSRNAYYKWLDGKGVSDEHAKRLTELLDAFRTIRDLHGPALKEFLETPDPAGRPIDLLAAGKYDVVIGLALRPLPTHEDANSVSKAARDISGLSGWARPAVRLNWGAPHLSAVELDRALDRLSPRPLLGHEESPGDDVVGAVIKPLLENLSQMQKDGDPDLDALDNVKEVRLAKIVGKPPFDVRLLFIIPEEGLPDKGVALARLVFRIRTWFNPLAARLVAWEARHLYEITVGDYLDTQQIYLEQYTYQGQIIRGLLPAANI